MEHNEKYEQARKKVQKLKGFYIHLFVYIVVNLGLFLNNMVFSSDSIWFIYPLFGWGIGIVAHGLSIYLFGGNWEERQIEKYLRK